MNSRIIIACFLILGPGFITAQIALPTLTNCADELAIPQLNGDVYFNQNDTANFCIFQSILDNEISATTYHAVKEKPGEFSTICFDSGRFKAAIHYANYGLQLAVKYRDTSSQLKNLQALAAVSYRSGKYLESHAYTQKGLLLSTEFNNGPFHADFLIRNARLTRILPNVEKAQALLKKARNILDTLPNLPEVYFNYYNGQALILRGQAQYAAARIYGDSALQIARNINSKKLTGKAMAALSFYYPLDSNEEIDLRIDLCKQAIKINHEMNDREQLCDNYNLLATHYYRDKQWETAIEYYLQGFEYMKQINDRNKMYNFHLGMYRTLDSLGLKEEAYQYKLKESEFYKEIYGARNVVSILNLHNEVAETKSEKQINQLEFEKEISELKNSRQRNNLLLILLAATILIALLYFNTIRLKQKKEVEALKLKQEASEKILELEKKALRSQMNPHFIFNSLNSIKSYIIKSEPRTAAKHLTKFAQLMRMILRNSEKQLITIAAELKALEIYIELEQFRLRNNLKYNIDIEPGLEINRWKIPPLIIQPYVENAILHGLSNKLGDKKLDIKLSSLDDKIQIQIIDNGVGRQATRRKLKPDGQKSFGMKITQERLQYNNPQAAKNLVQIKDLVNADGCPGGTEVCLRLPKITA